MKNKITLLIILLLPAYSFAQIADINIAYFDKSKCYKNAQDIQDQNPIFELTNNEIKYYENDETFIFNPNFALTRPLVKDGLMSNWLIGFTKTNWSSVKPITLEVILKRLDFPDKSKIVYFGYLTTNYSEV